jgi:streptogramin lyase
VGVVVASAGVGSATTIDYQWARTVSTYGSDGTSTFHSAQSVTVDPSGNVWATDTTLNGTYAAVVKFDGSGNWLGTSNQLQLTDGLHSDPAGNIWVAGGSRSNGLCVAEFGSGGAVLQQFSMDRSGTPSDVAVDPSGNFWVTYWTGGPLDEFNSSGTAIGTNGPITGGGSRSLFGPCGLAIDKSGNVWVSDTNNNRIVEFSNNGTFLQQFGSNGQLNSSEALAFDSAGNLWVADAGNYRIVEFSSTGTYLGQLGSRGTGPGQFEDPQGVAFDAAGNLWVADTDNNRLQEFSPVPEPSTLVLLSIGAVSFLAYAWRRRAKAS